MDDRRKWWEKSKSNKGSKLIFGFLPTMKTCNLISTFLLASLITNGQPKYFEFSNPTAINLTQDTIETILTHKWYVVSVLMENRGNMNETKGRHSFEMRGDQTFKYSYADGTWEIREGKYIDFCLGKKEDEGRLNFGGLYAVTSLTDSTLTLTKLLTSSHDMKRIVHLKDSQSYRGTEYPSIPYYTGKVDQKLLDSISRFDAVELFETGFNFTRDSIFIQTKDSLYRIPRRIEKDK